MPSPNVVTALNLDDPQTLIRMVDKALPAPRFLRERYFPCNPDVDIFPTETILIDYRDKAGRALAPLVHEGHKTTGRRSFYTDRLAPARIAPTRKLAIVDLIQRGFGESLFSGQEPEQRAVSITLNDIKELKDEVHRRLEKMAADLLQKNAYTLPYEKSDADGESEVADEVEVSFIDDVDGNIAAYTPTAHWNETGADVLGDIKAMVRKMQDNGAIGGPVDLVLGSDAADAFLADAQLLKLLDIRRVEAGKIEPEIIAQGAALLGQINVHGVIVNVIEYAEKYTDENKNLVPFLAPGAAFVANPNCGRSMYAAVTQLEQYDNNFHTYLQPIVPKYLGDPAADNLKLMLTSRPLLAPVVKGGWVSATVVSSASDATEEENETKA